MVSLSFVLVYASDHALLFLLGWEIAALSAWWLRERHGRGVVGAVLLGFVGIVLLLRPQGMFGARA